MQLNILVETIEINVSMMPAAPGASLFNMKHVHTIDIFL